MEQICVLMGSPRRNGNTEQLLRPLLEALEGRDCACRVIRLYDKRILPCTACRSCQRDWSAFGCRQRDDMEEIFQAVLECGLLLLATPIYSWYCTPPMKAALDRLVYGMNKYYGGEKGPALWAGKAAALLVTCGYPPEKGADLWEAGMKRYCKHSQLRYLGMLAEHDRGYAHTFMDEEKRRHAAAFARELLEALDRP